jgi:hypothetical protein
MEYLAKQVAEAKAKPAKARGKALKLVPEKKLYNCSTCQETYVNQGGETKCQACLEKPVPDKVAGAVAAYVAAEKPSKEEAEESTEGEEFSMLKSAAYKADPFSGAKVDDGLNGPGHVTQIGVGDDSGDRIYGVKFENGEKEDFSLDEIKEILVAEPASKEAEPEKEAAEEPSKEEVDEADEKEEEPEDAAGLLPEFPAGEIIVQEAAEPEEVAEETDEKEVAEEADEEPEEPSKEEADEKAKNDDAYKDKLRMLQRSLLLK